VEVLSIPGLKALSRPRKVILTVHPDSVTSVASFLEGQGWQEELLFLETRSFYEKDGKVHVFDSNQWVRSLPWHMLASHEGVAGFSATYHGEIMDNNLTFFLKDSGFEADDKCSRYVNAREGTRVTAGAPDSPANRIIIAGSSVAYGLHSEDKHTVQSFLQARLNDQFPHERVAVVNKGIYLYPFDLNVNDVLRTCLAPGDEVYFIYGCCLAWPNPKALNFTVEEAQDLFLLFLTRMNDHCRDQGARFTFCATPAAEVIQNPSPVEKFLGQDCVYHGHPHFGSHQFHTSVILEACRGLAIDVLDLAQACERPHGYGEIFIDPRHLSPNGNRLVADAILAHRLADERTTTHSAAGPREVPGPLLALEKAYAAESRRYSDANLSHFRGEDIINLHASYGRLAQDHPGSKGCIVVNCNPFTRGHDYLIETCSRQVDHLFIFVLEEDRSIFPFQDRFAMVKAGVARHPNVSVIKSDKFVISALTFPAYFEKERASDRTVDCTLDLDTFGRIVAPALQLTKRFVGTEPTCRITAQYNLQMKARLPLYGIEVVELERCTAGDAAISASRVRKLLAEARWEELDALVPPTTLNYLKEHFAGGVPALSAPDGPSR
jgi:hypothetical protein